MSSLLWKSMKPSCHDEYCSAGPNALEQRAAYKAMARFTASEIYPWWISARKKCFLVDCGGGSIIGLILGLRQAEAVLPPGMYFRATLVPQPNA